MSESHRRGFTLFGLFASIAFLAGCAQEMSLEEVKSGIRDFEYQMRIACERGSDSCLDFKIENSYPGLLTIPQEDVKEMKKYVTWGFPGASDLNSIAEDPDWLYPVMTCERDRNWLSSEFDLSKPLPGTTFSIESGTGADKTTHHITYLDGKWYEYPILCNPES
jgi:hypothetical protein